MTDSSAGVDLSGLTPQITAIMQTYSQMKWGNWEANQPAITVTQALNRCDALSSRVNGCLCPWCMGDVPGGGRMVRRLVGVLGVEGVRCLVKGAGRSSGWCPKTLLSLTCEETGNINRTPQRCLHGDCHYTCLMLLSLVNFSVIYIQRYQTIPKLSTLNCSVCTVAPVKWRERKRCPS